MVVYLPLWKIWKSVEVIIPNIWKTCSKPPTSQAWTCKFLIINWQEITKPFPRLTCVTSWIQGIFYHVSLHEFKGYSTWILQPITCRDLDPYRYSAMEKNKLGMFILDFTEFVIENFLDQGFTQVFAIVIFWWQFLDTLHVWGCIFYCLWSLILYNVGPLVLNWFIR